MWQVGGLGRAVGLFKGKRWQPKRKSSMTFDMGEETPRQKTGRPEVQAPLHPTPEIRIPNPETRNLKPETRDPKLET